MPTNHFENLPFPYNSEFAFFPDLGDPEKIFSPPEGPNAGGPIGEQIVLDGDVTDSDASIIIRVLIHDCFIPINQAQRGLFPEWAITMRFRLLSLYITACDLEAYYEGLNRLGLERRVYLIRHLVDLRDRTIFASAEKRQTMLTERAVTDVRNLRALLHIAATSEPIAGYDEDMMSEFNDTLRVFDQMLGQEAEGADFDEELVPAEEEDVVEVCNFFRTTLQFSPWVPSPPPAGPPAMRTLEREIALLYDIFHSFDAYVRYPQCSAIDRPQSARRFITLQTETWDTPYDLFDGPMTHFVFARDVLCGLLSGPSLLTGAGAYDSYVGPLLKSRPYWVLGRSPLHPFDFE